MAGMTERKIQELCDMKKARGFKAPPYWPSEIYGFGKWIREYCGYPRFLPLCIYTDHGPPILDVPLRQEIESGAPYQFCHSPTLVQKWRKRLKKEASVLYSPFIFCRRKRNFYKSRIAEGTLAFPAHTTANIDDNSDMEVYIKQLLKLPKRFQPVSVCLYYDDIKKNKHKIFQKYKIPIYTAGYYFDERFTERFYEILKNFKYATSNTAGSYLYYAVEMGIPFSIYGQKQKYVNKNDSNLSTGEYDPYKLSAFYRRLDGMFRGLNTKVIPEQKDFVEVNLGLKDGLEPDGMKKILYKSFFIWLFSFRVFKWLAKIVEVSMRYYLK